MSYFLINCLSIYVILAVILDVLQLTISFNMLIIDSLIKWSSSGIASFINSVMSRLQSSYVCKTELLTLRQFMHLRSSGLHSTSLDLSDRIYVMKF